AARGRHAALRRLLPLVPRRDGRDPQLADQQGEGVMDARHLQTGADAGHGISFSEAFRVWLRVASLSFGGPAGQIAVMHRILVEAVVRVGKRALKNRIMIALAAIAFVAIFFFAVPFPIIIIAAGVIGYIGARQGRPEFAPAGHGPGASSAVVDSMLGDAVPE